MVYFARTAASVALSVFFMCQMTHHINCYLVYSGEIYPPCKNFSILNDAQLDQCNGYLVMEGIQIGTPKTLAKAEELLNSENFTKTLVNFKDRTQVYWGYTSLMWAAKKNYMDLAKLLVDKGAKVTSLSGSKHSALYHAVMNNNSELVDLLLSHGADPNIAPTGSDPLILEACGRDLTKIVKSLLDNRATPNVSSSGGGYSCLYFAAKAGNVETVRELLKRNAVVDQRTSWNITPLFIAATFGRQEVVDMLLSQEYAADPNSADLLKYTPLHKASYYGYEGIAKALIAKGAEVEALDKRSNTALHYCAQGGWSSIAKELLKHCPDDQIENKKGKTPLEFLASELSYLERKSTSATEYVERIAGLKETKEVLENYDRSKCQ